MIAASLPLYLRLKEDKVKAEPKMEFIRNFWTQIKRRACWQIILYGMISHITFGVMNGKECLFSTDVMLLRKGLICICTAPLFFFSPLAAKMPANFVWLGLRTSQHQVMVIFEKIIFFIGLSLVRKYALNVSWRKSVLIGSCLVLVFNSMYFLIIFDVWRNSWFYIFTDVR